MHTIITMSNYCNKSRNYIIFRSVLFVRKWKYLNDLMVRVRLKVTKLLCAVAAETKLQAGQRSR